MYDRYLHVHLLHKLWVYFIYTTPDRAKSVPCLTVKGGQLGGVLGDGDVPGGQAAGDGGGAQVHAERPRGHEEGRGVEGQAAGGQGQEARDQRQNLAQARGK